MWGGPVPKERTIFGQNAFCKYWLGGKMSHKNVLIIVKFHRRWLKDRATGHHAGKSGVGEGEVVLKARRGEECGNGGFMQRLSTKLKYYSWHPPRVSESDWAEKKYSWEWLKLQRKTQKLWDATVEEYHHKTLSSIWPSLAGRSHPNCLLIFNWIGIFTQK